MANSTAKQIKITHTNLFVLRSTFKNTDRVSNRLPASDYSHLSRCLKAGLISLDGSELVITETGRQAIS